MSPPIWPAFAGGISVQYPHNFPQPAAETPLPYLLDLPSLASQTQFMAHTYLLFDFGTNEEKAQLARHKLEGWKQAFRLDKKLLYKFERPDAEAGAGASEAAPQSDEVPKAEKSNSKSKAKSKAKAKPAESSRAKESPPADGNVNLLVRLYFSGHEKLTEHRWIERIPTEEPFKEASPRVVRQGAAQWDDVDKQFESLE
ncbi:MAG: hypothetical protein WBF09_16465 [Candidatus Acidiferrum sp.]